MRRAVGAGGMAAAVVAAAAAEALDSHTLDFCDIVHINLGMMKLAKQVAAKQLPQAALHRLVR